MLVVKKGICCNKILDLVRSFTQSILKKLSQQLIFLNWIYSLAKDEMLFFLIVIFQLRIYFNLIHKLGMNFTYSHTFMFLLLLLVEAPQKDLEFELVIMPEKLLIRLKLLAITTKWRIIGKRTNLLTTAH